MISHCYKLWSDRSKPLLWGNPELSFHTLKQVSFAVWHSETAGPKTRWTLSALCSDGLTEGRTCFLSLLWATVVHLKGIFFAISLGSDSNRTVGLDTFIPLDNWGKTSPQLHWCCPLLLMYVFDWHYVMDRVCDSEGRGCGGHKCKSEIVNTSDMISLRHKGSLLMVSKSKMALFGRTWTGASVWSLCMLLHRKKRFDLHTGENN